MIICMFAISIILLILSRFFKNQFVVFVFTFPGTVLHELSHFIVGLLFNAKPTNFSLVPNKTESGYVLGSVSFRNINSLNAIPVGFAPLLLILVDVYLFFQLQKLDYSTCVFYGYLFFTITYSSLPSKQDLQVAFQYKFGILLYMCIILLLTYFLFRNFLYITN